MPDLHEVVAWHEVRDNSRIQADATVIILGDQACLTIGPEQLHDYIGLTIRFYHMAAIALRCEFEDIFFPRLTDIG